MDTSGQMLFDREALEEEWDADCALKLAQAFLSDTEGAIAEIDGALKRQDAQTVCASAHKLAGCSKVIMCRELADQSAALEKAAAAADWTQAASLFQSTVLPRYGELCLQLKDYLATA
jgi:HPt (histidine-containing phosphotransfer) domain-containing protein